MDGTEIDWSSWAQQPNYGPDGTWAPTMPKAAAPSSWDPNAMQSWSLENIGRNLGDNELSYFQQGADDGRWNGFGSGMEGVFNMVKQTNPEYQSYQANKPSIYGTYFDQLMHDGVISKDNVMPGSAGYGNFGNTWFNGNDGNIYLPSQQSGVINKIPMSNLDAAGKDKPNSISDFLNANTGEVVGNGAANEPRSVGEKLTLGLLAAISGGALAAGMGAAGAATGSLGSSALPVVEGGLEGGLTGGASSSLTGMGIDGMLPYGASAGFTGGAPLLPELGLGSAGYGSLAGLGAGGTALNAAAGGLGATGMPQAELPAAPSSPQGVPPPTAPGAPSGGSPFSLSDLAKIPGLSSILGPLLNGGGSGAGGAGGVGGDAGGAGGGLGGLNLNGLLGLIGGGVDASQQGKAAQEMKAWLQGQQGKIDNLYNPGTPEYNALWDEMSRKDAAAGRNSQYGPRSVDLAAKIAQIKADQTTRFTTGTSRAFADALNQNAGRFTGLNSAAQRLFAGGAGGGAGVQNLSSILNLLRGGSGLGGTAASLTGGLDGQLPYGASYTAGNPTLQGLGLSPSSYGSSALGFNNASSNLLNSAGGNDDWVDFLNEWGLG